MISFIRECRDVRNVQESAAAVLIVFSSCSPEGWY